MLAKKSQTRSRRGTTAVFTALILVVLFSFTAVGVDLTWLVSVSRELQSAADNSAIAGARKVRHEPIFVRELAVYVGAANKAARDPVQLRSNDDNLDDGDVVIGRYDIATHVFTAAIYDSDTGLPTNITPNAVKVVARRSGTKGVESLGGALPLLFAPVMGIRFADIDRPAIAMIEGSSGAGIIALCPDCECAFRVNGNTMIDVFDASIQVNSTHPCGGCGNGIPIVRAAELNLSGEAWCDTPQVDVQAEIHTSADGVEPVPDPLAGLPPPNYNPLTDLDLSCTYAPGATLNPGYFSTGIKHTTGTLNLNPGVYILDGPITAIAPTLEDFDARVVGASITTLTDSNWVGGSVATYPVTTPPPDPELPPPPTEYPLAASGENSYAVGAGLTITFNPPVDKVSFFFVHDSNYGFNVPQGNVDVINVCGDTGFSTTSKQATDFGDPLNFVTVTRASAGQAIKSLVFTNGGVIDSLTYTETKGGLHIGGGSTFTADGVMFYIAGGGVNVQGSSIVHITPIDSTQYAYTGGEAVYDGVSFFQARDNPSPPSDNVNDAKFMGTSDTFIYGQLYFPAAQVEIGGTPKALGSGIIAYTIWLHGTADSWRNLDPLTNPDLRVFLVE